MAATTLAYVGKSKIGRMIMKISKVILSDPLTWGAGAVSIVACVFVALRFPQGLDGRLLLAGFALAQVAAWLTLAGVTGRYRRRWSSAQRAEARDQMEQSQRRVDSLRLAFTRQDYEPGVACLEKLVDSYKGLRRAIGTRRSAPLHLQRRLSAVAADCYDSGLVELERLSGLVRTLHDTGGQADKNDDAARILSTSERLSGDLVAISLSFSDGSEDVDIRAEKRLIERLEAFEKPAPATKY